MRTPPTPKPYHALMLLPCLALPGCLRTGPADSPLTAAQQAQVDAYRQATAPSGAAARTMHRSPGRRQRPLPPLPDPDFGVSGHSAGVPLTTTANAESPADPIATATPPPAPDHAGPSWPAVAGQAAPAVSDVSQTSTPAADPGTAPGDTGTPRVARLSGRHLYGEFPQATTTPLASPLDEEGNLRRVTYTTEGADFDVEIDATGRWLAYASTRHRQTADLYLQRVDGTAVTQLTSDPARDEMPSLSPDGRRVAFASDRGGSFDIYLMEVEGGPAVKLTDDGAQNIHPSFSPDGQRLVYCSLGSQSGVWELVVLDIDRPGQRRIIGHGLFPVWSPSSNKIAYQRARQRGSRWFSLWTLELTDDGEVSRPVEIVASANAAVITPEWSPDGRNLVFCTVLDPTADSPAGSRADIWICNADGTGRTQLTRGRYGNLYPTWAADGSIYFVSNRGVDAIENVYALRPDQAVFMARQRQSATDHAGDPPREPDTAEAQVPTPIRD